MAYEAPNHLQEFADHLKSCFEDVLGDTDSETTYKNLDVSFNFVTEYRRLDLQQLQRLVNAQLANHQGCFLITQVQSTYRPKSYTNKRYEAVYDTYVYLACTMYKENQLEQDSHMMYLMIKALTEIVAPNPVQLTGCPPIPVELRQQDPDYADDEFELSKFQLHLTAPYKIKEQ